ncbi:Lysine--tRNA ligase [Planctomycetales bacterium 10988]|nr:Lysine--tRNA ligase [Planctomycetales bacterium 10988]
MSDEVPQSEAAENPSHLEAARREKLRRVQELGHDPWGQRFDDQLPIGSVLKLQEQVYYENEAGEKTPLPEDREAYIAWRNENRRVELHGPKVRAAGRIVLERTKGKLIFLDIMDWTGKVQIFVGRKQVGEENWALAECMQLGDIVGVDGEFKLTNTGEPTIFAEKLHFLSKSLETPPDKYHGIHDPEIRQRRRYLDLIHTDGVMERFLRRSKIVQSIRQTLASESFVEVEGPTLHSIAGGAAARPFTTHHNALDMDLFLRIALELHLKRLLVGGIERVYELGRVYRNEGISPKHNPEFTMLEAYQAYGDYRSMMDLTEKIIVNALEATGQPLKVQYGEHEIDFTPPFERKTYDELFLEHTGVDPKDEAAVAKLAAEIGFDIKGRHPDVIKSDVFEEKVEDALEGPIFVMDYPASICPLTKRSQTEPEIAERFELFVKGMELANAYTELNDPDLQEQLFKTQLEGMSAEDSMAKMDNDFVTALRNAMPPAGGLGIGIDRLVMLLTNATSIREVILFPLLRHEA